MLYDDSRSAPRCELWGARPADWIVDLGPEGGKDGGVIVAEGTPETVAAHYVTSHTGRYLKERLAEHPGRTSASSVRVASAGAQAEAAP